MKHITTLVTASIVAIVTLIKSVFLHPGCTVVRSCIHPQYHCRESVRSSYNVSFGLYKGVIGSLGRASSHLEGFCRTEA
jgi:hypothetical protein